MPKKTRAAYMISAVAEQYQIHPQTLRLYEREGLLKPSRSEGNTRLYTDEDLERLEVILKLTRDFGVNLAGGSDADADRAVRQDVERGTCHASAGHRSAPGEHSDSGDLGAVGRAGARGGEEEEELGPGEKPCEPFG